MQNFTQSMKDLNYILIRLSQTHYNMYIILANQKMQVNLYINLILRLMCENCIHSTHVHAAKLIGQIHFDRFFQKYLKLQGAF